jgi:ubiquinone/menaquinone biosynthesis C-methylase UbiE
MIKLDIMPTNQNIGQNINDTKEHWEKVYNNKSSFEVSWYQAEPALSLQFIHAAKLDKDAYIIDVGGGASTLVDHLYNESFRNLAVLDISARALDYAKNRLGNKAEDVKWIEADVTEFVTPNQFDLWHDRAVFHFLSEFEERRKYIESLKRTLRRGGHLILAAFAIGGPTKCSGLDIRQYDSARLQNEIGPEFKLVDKTFEIHITPGNKEQRFNYFRFIYK